MIPERDGDGLDLVIPSRDGGSSGDFPARESNYLIPTRDLGAQTSFPIRTSVVADSGYSAPVREPFFGASFPGRSTAIITPGNTGGQVGTGTTQVSYGNISPFTTLADLFASNFGPLFGGASTAPNQQGAVQVIPVTDAQASGGYGGILVIVGIITLAAIVYFEMRKHKAKE